MKDQNKFRTKGITFLSSLLICAFLWLQVPQEIVSAEKPTAVSASDLIITVNGLRTANGLNALTADNLLMISAQSHSEYQASLGYWTHEGPGGTNETDRAVAVGYGGGQTIKCDEAVAIASSTKDANYIVYTLWNDYVHRDVVLLNSSYIHVGAGVAKGADGLYYYTVDLCVINGDSPIYPTATTASNDQPITNGPTATYAPLITATPHEDGSVWHLVLQAGETIFDISVSYGVPELDILTMNGISPAYQIIYAGQLLLIKRAPTPTITPTITETPRPPTWTPRPSKTPRPTYPTSTPQNTSTLTPTATPVPGYYKALDRFSQQQWGAMIIAVSLLGILLLFHKELIRLVKTLAATNISKHQADIEVPRIMNPVAEDEETTPDEEQSEADTQ